MPVSGVGSRTERDMTGELRKLSELRDLKALDEIELFGELMAAAAEVEEPLSTDDIDKVLKVHHRPSPAEEMGESCPSGRTHRRGAGRRLTRLV
jgi:hypothetical protein